MKEKKKIKQKDNRSCNFCANQMRGIGSKFYFFCARPACPNYALLQIPEEYLDKNR